MLTHNDIKSVSSAVNYYSGARVVSLDGQETIVSGWYGKGAKELGLKGQVKISDFENILSGKIKHGGEEIQLGKKKGEEIIHAPGKDFTFNAPKSISLQANLPNGDKRLNKAILKAAKQTVDYIEENHVYTRVKIDGKIHRERVDNIVASYFLENLNRENEFHSHVHFNFANIIQKSNGQWRSAEFKNIVENKHFLGRIFRFNLAKEVKNLGYEIDVTDKQQMFFQLKGFDKDFIEFNSQRTKNINEKAKELDPNPDAITKQIANLLTRKAKKKSIDQLKTLYDKRIETFNEINKTNIIDKIKDLTGKSRQGSSHFEEKEISAKEAIGNAIEHWSERETIFSEASLIKTAMPICTGNASIQDLQKQIRKFFDRKVILSAEREYVVTNFSKEELEEKDPQAQITGSLFTTHHALEREKSIIQMMKNGKGSCKPILTKKRASELLNSLNENLDSTSRLNKGQLEAARSILSSKDRVQGIQGYAGTGKTYMLSKVAEVLDIINQEMKAENPNHAPYELRGLAPSGAAVKELQKVGIKSQTLQSITDKYAGYAEGRGTLEGAQEERIKFNNQLFVIDESSMIDAQTMHDFLVISKKLDLQSTLMGDIRQLSAVKAGNPLQELQKQGMSVVKMTEIRRQQNKIAKAIAYSAYARDFKGIFEKVGSNLVDCKYLIAEQINNGLRSKESDKTTKEDLAWSAAKLFFTFGAEKRANTLIVAQSNATKNLINQYVRKVLIEKNYIDERNSVMEKVLLNTNSTLAEKETISTYSCGNVILFNKGQRNLNINKNEYFSIIDIDSNKHVLTLNSLDDPEKTINFDLKLSKSYRKHLELYEEERKEFTINDKIMFTRKITSEGVNYLTAKENNNSEIINSTVGFIKNINNDNYIISLPDGDVKIDRSSNALRHLDYAYCRTAHKAQGATENTSIIVTESWYKYLTEERNFLVQATRHKDDLFMVVDDAMGVIDTLRNNLSRDEESAIEFVSLDKSLMQLKKLIESDFKHLGGDEEYSKYDIAHENSRSFDVNSKTLDLKEDNIEKHLTESGNIKKSVSAMEMILKLSDNDIKLVEKDLLSKQEEENNLIQEKKIKPAGYKIKKNKVIRPEFESWLVKNKFKEAIYNNLDASDFNNIDDAIEKAFSNTGQKQYFGSKKKGELLWHGIAGYAKDYKTGDYFRWNIGQMKLSEIDKKGVNYRTMSKEDLEKEKEMKILKAQKDAKEMEDARNKLSAKAKQIFNSISSEKSKLNAHKNKYLVKKQLSEYRNLDTIKVKENGDLIIPAKDLKGNIKTLQIIQDNGHKRKMFLKAFKSGAGNKIGCFFSFNEQNIKSNKARDIILTEGFATAASIDKALNNQLMQKSKIPIIHCFDAGNLEHCLKEMKDKYPHHNFIIAADDDSIKGGANRGLNAAQAAAKKYGAKVISPNFNNIAYKNNLPSDFNDLHVTEGIEKVSQQFKNPSNFKSYKPTIERSISKVVTHHKGHEHESI